MNKKIIGLILMACLLFAFAAIVYALPPSQTGGVVLSFDDGYQSDFDYGYPLMLERDMKGCFNIITIKPIEDWTMNWDTLRLLQADGNEIVSHTYDHPDFGTLTEEEIRFQCSQSRIMLEEQGLQVNNFVYSSGTGSQAVDDIVLEYYDSGRYGWGTMSWTYTGWRILGFSSYADTDAQDFENYKTMIDRVRDEGSWTVLYFHDVNPGNPNGQSITPEAFEQVLDYIIEQGVQVFTMNEALAISRGEPTPTLTPSGEMTAEEWTNFWDWLKTRQQETSWSNYLDQMLEQWQNTR